MAAVEERWQPVLRPAGHDNLAAKLGQLKLQATQHLDTIDPLALMVGVC